MRRVFAILVLVAGALSQLAAASCPMSAAAGDAQAAIGGHVHEAAEPGRASDEAPNAPVPDANCGLLVACAGAALAAAESTVTRVHLAEAATVEPARSSPWTSNFPQKDTPPPRRPV